MESPLGSSHYHTSGTNLSKLHCLFSSTLYIARVRRRVRCILQEFYRRKPTFIMETTRGVHAQIVTIAPTHVWAAHRIYHRCLTRYRDTFIVRFDFNRVSLNLFIFFFTNAWFAYDTLLSKTRTFAVLSVLVPVRFSKNQNRIRV